MKNKSFIVYKHTSPSGKVYIGQTCQSEAKRFRHDGTGYTGSPYFYSAIKKYGWNNFKHEVLESNLTKEQADEKEIEYISMYKSCDKRYGYNMSTGGEHGSVGVIRSEEYKQHLSKINKGKTLSEEHKRKIGNAHKGRKLTDVQRKRLSEINKGKKLSDEHRKKLSEVNKSRIRTKEEIEKSAAKRRGKPLSKETREKLSNALKGKKPTTNKYVVCVETGDIFISARQAGLKFGLKNGNNIGMCCRGKRKICMGYHWNFYDHPTEE